LGAKPGDLFRKFLTESILLSLVGGAVGVFAAFFITRLIRSVNVATLPRSGHVHIDLVVLLFTLCASLVTAIVFGVVPWITSRANVQEALKEGGHSSSEGTTRYRLRASIVVGEVALAVVLLAGAGLMIKSVQLLKAVNSGFDDNNVLIFNESGARFVGRLHHRASRRLGMDPAHRGRLGASCSHSCICGDATFGRTCWPTG
jgi:putative ABC transport system permease protein